MLDYMEASEEKWVNSKNYWDDWKIVKRTTTFAFVVLVVNPLFLGSLHIKFTSVIASLLSDNNIEMLFRMYQSLSFTCVYHYKTLECNHLIVISFKSCTSNEKLTLIEFYLFFNHLNTVGERINVRKKGLL